MSHLVSQETKYGEFNLSHARGVKQYLYDINNITQAKFWQYKNINRDWTPSVTSSCSIYYGPRFSLPMVEVVDGELNHTPAVHWSEVLRRNVVEFVNDIVDSYSLHQQAVSLTEGELNMLAVRPLNYEKDRSLDDQAPRVDTYSLEGIKINLYRQNSSHYGQCNANLVLSDQNFTDFQKQIDQTAQVVADSLREASTALFASSEANRTNDLMTEVNDARIRLAQVITEQLQMSSQGKLFSLLTVPTSIYKVAPQIPEVYQLQKSSDKFITVKSKTVVESFFALGYDFASEKFVVIPHWQLRHRIVKDWQNTEWTEKVKANKPSTTYLNTKRF